MRRLLCVIALMVALLMVGFAVSGCGGVVLSADYSRLLDQTAALSAETAARAERDELTPDQMKAALIVQADVWRRFQDGRDGKRE